MCGIHLIIQKSGENEIGRAAISRMVKALEHRGPDGKGVIHLDWGEEQIFLGHNLLAIHASPSDSHQPMVYPDGQSGIIFNGQIYNHSELRKQLADDGIEVANPTDTAVLLAWLRFYGRKGLRKLVGMFAFVFWDSTRQLLIIHRDGYGIKPLFTARNRHFFLASSEPAALFAAGLIPFSIDHRSLAQYLKYKFIAAPASPWFGIKSLSPGEVIEYWEGKPMHFQVRQLSPQAMDYSLERALDMAFLNVIPRNEPFGLMFSGGLDSSLILHWCLKNKLQVQPYSIRFLWPENQPFYDQESAKEIAGKWGVQVRWIDIGKDDFQGLSDFLKGNQPIVADSAWWLTDKIARQAKKDGLRILLSGAGADEWFAGYRRHGYFYQWTRFQGFFPQRLQAAVLAKLKRNSTADAKEIPLPQAVWEAGVSNKLSPILQYSPSLPLHEDFSDHAPLHAALRWDQDQYLPNDILAITDLATMAHGIEGRFPFLHPAITQWADAQSPIDRIEAGRKHFLLELFDEPWKTYFRKRKKLGFGIPMAAFLESEAGTIWLNEFVWSREALWKPWFNSRDWQHWRANFSAKKFPQEAFTLAWLSHWLDQNKNQG